jgi:serine/threonine-protein kinase HipA
MILGEVRLWGALVGNVAWDESRDIGVFEYVPEYIERGVELSPLKMPLKEGPYDFPGLNRESFKGLPGMLADSLPDKFGNALIDQWLAETRRTPESFNSVERLLYIGTRGMGALEFQPAIRNATAQKISLDIEELVRISSEVLTRREQEHAHLSSENADENVEGIENILAVGTSAGGARAKAIIAWNEETNEVRSGQIDVGDGFSFWLLKFDGVSNNKDKELADPKGYGCIEYAYYLMAKAAGIDMTESRLMRENGRSHFMTKRFDRADDGQKIHMQSLCALGHYDFNMDGGTSYEQAFLVGEELGLGMRDKEQLFLRMVFNVLAYNRDDHTKQISFLMDKSGEWRLSPAYDVTYSYNPAGDFTSRQQMTVNRKRDDITDKDFLEVAKRQGLKLTSAKRMIKDVRAVLSSWSQYADSATVSVQKEESIGRLIVPS